MGSASGNRGYSGRGGACGLGVDMAFVTIAAGPMPSNVCKGL